MDELDRKGLDTKDKILDVALDLFSSQGFHGTSMREIASKVGIRKSSIYNHFSGKEDILEKIFISFGPGTIKDKIHSEEMKEKMNSPYQFLHSITELTKKIISDPKEQKFIKIVLIEHNNSVLRKEVKERFLRNLRGELVDIFQKMMDKGLIKEKDPVVLANEFIGPLIFMRLEYILSGGGPEELEYINNFVDKHVDFIWDSIRK